MQFWDQACRSSVRVVATWAGEYDTCGDGLTQHGPAGVVGEFAFADYMSSLAQAMLDDPTVAPIVDRVYPCMTASQHEILFFAGVKPAKNGKSRYYCRSERKVSTAESRRHDRRWLPVPDWADGSVEAVHRLIDLDESGESQWHNTTGLLRVFCEFEHIVETMNVAGLHPHDLWDSTANRLKLTDPNGVNIHARGAWCALRFLVDGFRSATQGRRSLETYLHNAKSV
jgi:hypothetical protein